MIFSSFSDIELKEVGPSSNNLSKDRQNSNLPVQGEEMFFSLKKKFVPFSDIQPKFIGYLFQSLRRRCQNWIQHKQRIMSKKKLLFCRNYTFFYQISTLSEKLSALIQEIFRRICQKTAFS